MADRVSDRPEPIELAIVLLLALSGVVFFEPAPVDFLTIALLPIALFARRLAIPRTAAFVLVSVGMFLLANLISLPFSGHLETATRFLAITVYLAASWILILGLAGKLGARAIRFIMLGWVIAVVVTVTPAIASYFGVLPFADQLAKSGRLHGLFKDANVLGAWLVPPAVWAVSRLVSLESTHRVRWAAVLGVCGTGVLLTYSRGAWISIAVALTVFFALRMVAFGTPRARLMTLLALPIAAFMVALAFDRIVDIALIQEMLEQRLGPQHYDSDRFATQQDALQTALQRPLGIGPGQVEKTFVRAAHNAYVRALVENGFLGGLSLTLIYLGSLLRATWTAIDARDPSLQSAMAVVAAGMAAVCVESLVIDSIHWRHTWVLAALAWTPSLVRSSGPTWPPSATPPAIRRIASRS